MSDKTYTILDLAEEFGKDKQLIRRRIAKLKLQSINKDTREYSNDPLEYNHYAYLKLAKELGLSESNTYDMHETCDDVQSNTHETRDETQKYTDDLSRDKLIEVLERELKHSKDKLEKAEQEKENLYKLLSQQQQLSLTDKNKVKILELEREENIYQEELYKEKKVKWYDIFKRNK